MGASEETRCDVAIVGCGVAGLYAALNLPRTMGVVMLSKGPLEQCDSMLAQGGICMQADDADYAPYLEDTLRAGHRENRVESVDAMIRSSRRTIRDLVSLGVEFEREPDGSLAFTREGAHSRPRICYHADTTGREITTRLLAHVRALPNVTVVENAEMVDLLCEPGEAGERCVGVVAVRPDGSELELHAGATLLATGGVGGLYERSTNWPLLTGDGCRVAAAHGAELEHMDYVQVHPTTLWTGEPGRALLVSESCRGEGAVLLDARGERFCDELQPRDVVTATIRRQMELDGADHVMLSFAGVDPEVVVRHFPTVRQVCLDAGYDVLREPIPVVPAQHYLMGGIRVDLDSATTLPGLWAAGECSCNGVHGRNRLASNSLLESLVFARRAAYTISCGGSLEPDGSLPREREEAR